MRILNFGSLNLDYVYHVSEIVKPGQTIDSLKLECFPGGKGLNQTLALARAAATVYHAGMIGEDGIRLKQLLETDHVDCSYLRTVDRNTGTAFIQVASSGQNCIVLDGGANRMNTTDFCDEVLAHFGEGDILLLQNEINLIDYLIDRASEKGMYIVLNPSPFNQNVMECNLNKVSLFVMNEDEGQSITGKAVEEDILSEMRVHFPNAEVVLTLGAQGVIYQKGEQILRQGAYLVKAIDTTAAGDTFTGYLLASMANKLEIAECLKLANKAAAIAVTRMGASSSIPYIKEVLSTNL